jgi:flavin reductase (DIM6/NTAB) family NADH-FMN oxidoreductase RutF
MEKVSINPFTKFAKDWALVTAGTKEKFNSMTIAWGGMGTLWRTPVLQIFIRPNRYTFKFLEENEYFTVSFYDKKYKKALGIMGSKSGRDFDKVKLAGLTPKFLENGITYEEATETYVCKKIYMNEMDKSKFPEKTKDMYKDEPAHYVIFGELINV